MTKITPITETQLYKSACQLGQQKMLILADMGFTFESAWTGITHTPDDEKVRALILRLQHNVSAHSFALHFNAHFARSNQEFPRPINSLSYSSWQDLCNLNPNPFSGNDVKTEEQKTPLGKYEARIKELKQELKNLQEQEQKEKEKEKEPLFRIGQSVLIPAKIIQIDKSNDKIIYVTQTGDGEKETGFFKTITAVLQENVLENEMADLKNYEKNTGKTSWLKTTIKTWDDPENWPLVIKKMFSDEKPLRFTKSEALLIATKILRDMSSRKD